MCAAWLAIDVEPDVRCCRVVIRGELDLATVPRLEAELRRLASECYCSVDLDLGQVEFLGVEGAAMLLRARREYFPPPCVLRILRPKPIAVFVLGLFRLDELIDPPIGHEPDDRFYYLRSG